MEPASQDDGGGGRKVGLARLAKNHNLSGSSTSLQHVEGKSLDEKEDMLTLPSQPSVVPSVTITPAQLSLSSPEPGSSRGGQKTPSSPPDQQVSPLRSLGKQGSAVNLLPNKMNVSELSGQAGDRKSKSEDDTMLFDSSSHGHIPCSDPDFIRNAKSSIRTSQSLPLAEARDAAAGKGEEKSGKTRDDKASSPKMKGGSSAACATPKKSSPLLSRRSRLAPPQVKRSSSMTRLSEAINQIHNVCVFPAQSITTMVQNVEVVTETRGQPLQQLPSSEQEGLSRSPSWYGGCQKTSGVTGDDDDREEATGSPLPGCRSASLDELNTLGLSHGLPIISPLDAKRKNYLFGGLNSLLGASELDRYFPNRTINLFIATWNMNGKEPPVNLEAFLLPDEMDHMPDMFVVGTQESGGSRSEWEVRLQATIGPSHVLFTSAIFGVLHLTIFIRRDLLWFCTVPEEATYSVRPGIAYKTKGGVGVGFQFFGTRLLFINSHLTAHEEKQAYRIQNFRNIIRSLDIPRLLPRRHKHKDVTYQYDSVFWLGDLNFRLAVNRDHVFEKLKTGRPEAYQHLLQWDQLSQARRKGEAFNDFEEGEITFAPTFKYDPGTDHYDTSTKQRVPSYTDRILFKSSRKAVTCTSYGSCSLFRTSDHKPVLGTFHCKIRPGKDDVPLAAGLFNRDVYIEALRRRRRFLNQPTMRNCPVQ